MKTLSDDQEAPWRAADAPPAVLHETTRGPLGAPTSGDNSLPLSVDQIVARAVRAQHQFATWNERQIDDVLERVAESVASAAEDLARYAADETGMGNARDKMMKISFASRTVQQDLRGRLVNIQSFHRDDGWSAGTGRSGAGGYGDRCGRHGRSCCNRRAG